MRINVSYTYRLPNDVDLVFVKRDRYVIALFMCLDIIAVMLIISTELFSFMFILHIRGLYTIAIRRIKKGMAQSLLTTSSYDKYIIIYDSVAKSMETYKSMIQCRIHFKQTFLSHYFCMYLVSVVFPATTLLRIMQAMTDPDDNINNIVLGSMSLLIFTGFVYILNYLSQLVIDDNDEFFDTPYNTEWYEAPLPAQKLLLFIMRGRTNNTDTNLYGMYKPSMQGISTHMKISWSYFMTLYSIR
ncbi:uncharacterized protein LOC143182666 [Calliopsis andreniformis]|uniref:uncharacterized protein LOC143182666 n=1 Tax=Calliopsis andreniformis TaxID=337506 RepID=UPI003FCE7BB4